MGFFDRLFSNDDYRAQLEKELAEELGVKVDDPKSAHDVDPVLALKRVDKDASEVGKHLAEIVSTPGFKLLLALLVRRRLECGRMSLHDDTHSREWWQGFEAGAYGIEGFVSELVEQHRMKDRKDRGDVSKRMRVLFREVGDLAE
jgi:hypothetical protein